MSDETMTRGVLLREAVTHLTNLVTIRNDRRTWRFWQMTLCSGSPITVDTVYERTRA
jgi:hypothetical protein